MFGFSRAIFALGLCALPIVALAQTQPGSIHSSSSKSDRTIVGALPSSLQGRPVVVRIHADWCSACKATHATYQAVQQQYAGKATFVTFDVTDAQTAAAAEEKAKSLGLIKIYDADKTATSTVAVINPRNGAVEASLYNDNVAADYDKAIDRVVDELAAK